MRSLPKLSKSQKQPSTADTVAGLIFAAVFGAWWLVALKHQFWILGPGTAYLRFGPLWQSLYPWFAVAIVTDIVRRGIALLRPDWEIGRLVLAVFHRAISLLLLYFLFKAADLIVVGDAMDPNLQPALQSLNHVIHLCIAVGIVITVAQSAWAVYRYFFRRPDNGYRAFACF